MEVQTKTQTITLETCNKGQYCPVTPGMVICQEYPCSGCWIYKAKTEEVGSNEGPVS